MAPLSHATSDLINKSYWFDLQNISRIQLFLTISCYHLGTSHQSLSPRWLTSLQVSLLLHLFPPVNWVILLKQKANHVTPLLKAPGKVLRIAPWRLWNLYPTRTQSTITLVCSFHSSHTGQNSLGLPQCFGTIPSTWNAFPRDINMANSLPTKSLPISVSRSPPYFKFQHPQKFWIPPALLHFPKHLPLNILYYFLFITPH